MFVDPISIDPAKCIGCGKCASICIRDAIEVQGRKAVFLGGPCFCCYQCSAVCPVDSISISEYPGFEAEPVGPESPVSGDVLLSLMKSRRSVRWFTDEKVCREEFEKMFEAARYSPTSMHRQDVEFVVVDERLEEFMQQVYEALKPLEDTLPRIHEFCQYHEGIISKPKGHPLLWGGNQLILTFSEVAVDSIISMTRVELMGYSIGVAGFYSLFLIMAAEREPERFSRFFPGIDPKKKLRCAYVVGHPAVRYRRTVPPRRVSVNYN